MDIFLYRCLASNLFSLVFVVRGVEELGGVQNYKTTVTKQLIDDVTPFGAFVGDQFSSINGLPSAKWTFKPRNPIYYIF